MKVKMKMPDLGTTVDEITVVNWLVEVGQEVKRGQALLEVETDKATMEVESFVSGTLEEICVPVNGVTTTGSVIAVIAVTDV
ncbi:MAG: biotin attachment protein [Lentisphaerae bacterium]|nr:biotin attachment protein [Lentisphaerota bacterium]